MGLKGTYADLTEFVELVNINMDCIKVSRVDFLDLLGDDLLNGLGYDRKRNKGSITKDADGFNIHMGNDETKGLIKVDFIGSIESGSGEEYTHDTSKSSEGVVVVRVFLDRLQIEGLDETYNVKCTELSFNSEANNEQALRVLDALSYSAFDMKKVAMELTTESDRVMVATSGKIDELVEGVEALPEEFASKLRLFLYDATRYKHENGVALGYSERVESTGANESDETEMGRLEDENAKQKEEIEKQREKLEEQGVLLENREKEIEEHRNRLEEQRVLLESKEKELEEQRVLLESKENELEELKSKLENTQTSLGDSSEDDRAKDLEEQKEALDSREAEIERRESENKALDEKLKTLEWELQRRESESKDLDDKLKTLGRELQRREEELKNREEGLCGREAEIERRESESKNEAEKVKGLEEEIASLKQQLETRESSGESGENSGASSGKANDRILEAYKEQINNLSCDLEVYKKDLNAAKSEIESLKKQLEDKEESSDEKFNKMMEIFETNEDAPRTYVYGINSDISQVDSLEKMVGEALSKLYTLAGFEASQYIFDGDLFRLVPPVSNGDTMIGNKRYDVDLCGASEDTVIQKLAILFSKFPKINFNCRKFGRLDFVKDDEETADNVSESDEVYEGDYTREGEESDEFADGGAENSIEESGEYLSEGDETYESDETYEGDETYAGGESSEVLVVASLSQYDLLEEIPGVHDSLYRVTYLGNNDRTYNIRYDNYEQLFNRLVEAVLLLKLDDTAAGIYYDLCYSKMTKSLILSRDRAHLVERGVENTEERFLKSDIGLKGFRGISDVINSLKTLMEGLDIDDSELFIYFEADQGNENLEEWYIDEYSVPKKDSSEILEQGLQGQSYPVVIKGDFISRVTMNYELLDIGSTLFGEITAIKNTEIGKVITNYSEVAEFVSESLGSLAKCTEEALASVWKLYSGDRTYQFLSYDKSKVGELYHEIKVWDSVVYVSEFDSLNTILALLKLQYSLHKNYKIAIKVMVNEAVANYYNSFETSETGTALNIRCLMEYVKH